MADSVEENTQWVYTWIANDEEYYYDARRLAQDEDIEGLKEFIIQTLKSAPDKSEAHYIAREMTDTDYERTDYGELAECLAD